MLSIWLCGGLRWLCQPFCILHSAFCLARGVALPIRLFGQRLPALYLHLHRLNTRSGISREKAQETQRGTAAAEVKTVLTQRRRDSQRDAEKEERKKGLFSSAFLRALCVSAFILLSFEQVRILIPFSCAFCASSRQRGFPHLSRQ